MIHHIGILVILLLALGIVLGLLFGVIFQSFIIVPIRIGSVVRMGDVNYTVVGQTTVHDKVDGRQTATLDLVQCDQYERQMRSV